MKKLFDTLKNTNKIYLIYILGGIAVDLLWTILIGIPMALITHSLNGITFIAKLGFIIGTAPFLVSAFLNIFSIFPDASQVYYGMGLYFGTLLLSRISNYFYSYKYYDFIIGAILSLLICCIIWYSRKSKKLKDELLDKEREIEYNKRTIEQLKNNNT